MEGLRNFAVWLLIFGLVGVYAQRHEEPETDTLTADFAQGVSDFGEEIVKSIPEKLNMRVRRLDPVYRRARPASPPAGDFQNNQPAGQQLVGRPRTTPVGPEDRNIARNAAATARARRTRYA